MENLVSGIIITVSVESVYPLDQLPFEYYQFLRQEISIEELYEQYPNEYKVANWKNRST